MNNIIDHKILTMRLKIIVRCYYHVAEEGAESDEMGFNSSSGIPEFRMGMTRSSISGKTNFF